MTPLCLHHSCILAIIGHSHRSFSSRMERPMRIMQTLVHGLCVLALASCSSLTIEHVNYGWPVEVVTTVPSTNLVTAERYGLTFSVAKIAAAEFQDSTALTGQQVRFLRSNEGYYFLTGPR